MKVSEIGLIIRVGDLGMGLNPERHRPHCKIIVHYLRYMTMSCVGNHITLLSVICKFVHPHKNVIEIKLFKELCE